MKLIQNENKSIFNFPVFLCICDHEVFQRWRNHYIILQRTPEKHMLSDLEQFTAVVPVQEPRMLTSQV